MASLERITWSGNTYVSSEGYFKDWCEYLYVEIVAFYAIYEEMEYNLSKERKNTNPISSRERSILARNYYECTLLRYDLELKKARPCRLVADIHFGLG